MVDGQLWPEWLLLQQLQDGRQELRRVGIPKSNTDPPGVQYARVPRRDVDRRLANTDRSDSGESQGRRSCFRQRVPEYEYGPVLPQSAPWHDQRLLWRWFRQAGEPE